MSRRCFASTVPFPMCRTAGQGEERVKRARKSTIAAIKCTISVLVKTCILNNGCAVCVNVYKV
eukprot:349801-Chlamydomonas_euryale.AAC.7